MEVKTSEGNQKSIANTMSDEEAQKKEPEASAGPGSPAKKEKYEGRPSIYSMKTIDSEDERMLEKAESWGSSKTNKHRKFTDDIVLEKLQEAERCKNTIRVKTDLFPQPPPKRKRGRPPKVKTEVTVEEPLPVENDQDKDVAKDRPQRARKRPIKDMDYIYEDVGKGNVEGRNMREIKGTVSYEECVYDDVVLEEIGTNHSRGRATKRPRGRSPKDSTMVVTEKRRPGRPRKSLPPSTFEDVQFEDSVVVSVRVGSWAPDDSEPTSILPDNDGEFQKSDDFEVTERVIEENPPETTVPRHLSSPFSNGGMSVVNRGVRKRGRGRPPKSWTRPSFESKRADSSTDLVSLEEEQIDERSEPDNDSDYIASVIERRGSRSGRRGGRPRGSRGRGRGRGRGRPRSTGSQRSLYTSESGRALACIREAELSYVERDSITCGKCNEVFEGHKFFRHILFTHNGLARPAEESQDFEDREVRSRAYLTLKYKKSIKCSTCAKSFTNMNLYIYHCMYKCAQAKQKVDCPVCGKKVHEFYLETHKKTHISYTPEEEEKKEEKEEEKERPEGRSHSRRAAQKAISTMSNLIKEESNVDMGKRLKRHIKEEEDEKFCLEDTYPDCSDSYETINKDENGTSVTVYKCKKCSDEEKTKEDILLHVVNVHIEKSTGDVHVSKKEAREGSYNQSLTYRQDVKDLIAKAVERESRIQGKELFKDLHSKKEDWIEIATEKQEEHLPTTLYSPYFKTQSFKEWQALHRLEGHVDEDGSRYLFCGGVVTGVRWCPFPESGPQYLAVTSTGDVGNSECMIGAADTRNSCIQLWKLNDSEAPSISLLLSFGKGPAWDMDWCPSGAAESPEETTPDRLRRLGLLAVACCDGNVRIFSVPHPHQLSSKANVPMYKTSAMLTLLPRLKGTSSHGKCMKLCWHRDFDHRYLMASYDQGLIAMWDLTTSSPLLRVNPNSLLPYHAFFGHKGMCSAIDFISRPDDRQPALMVSGGWDKVTRMWSMDSTDAPMIQATRHPNLDLKWMPSSLQGLVIYDMITPCNASTNVYFFVPWSYLDRDIASRSVSSLSPMARSLAYNHIAGVFLVGDEVGNLTAVFAPLQCPLHHRVLRRSSLIDANIVALEEHNNNSTDEDATKDASNALTYQGASSKYGIEFSDSSSIKQFSLVGVRNQDKALPASVFETYPLRAILSVDWNPNLDHGGDMAAGYQCGIIRIKRYQGLHEIIHKSKESVES